MPDVEDFGRSLPDVPKTFYTVVDPAIGRDYVLICAPIAIFRNDDKSLNIAVAENFVNDLRIAKLPGFKTVAFSSGPVR